MLSEGPRKTEQEQSFSQELKEMAAVFMVEKERKDRGKGRS